MHSKGEEELYNGQLFNMPCKAPSPFMFTVQINQAKLQMEVDKGASASIISYDTFALLWSKSQRPQLRPSNRKLHTYTGEGLVVKEQLTVENVYGDQQEKLPLLVVASNGPSLMG